MKKIAISAVVTAIFLGGCGDPEAWQSEVYETPEDLCEAGGAERGSSGESPSGVRGYCVGEGDFGSLERKFVWLKTGDGYVYEQLQSQPGEAMAGILEDSPTPSPTPSPTEQTALEECEGVPCAELLRAYLVSVVGIPQGSVPSNERLDAMGNDVCDVLIDAQTLRAQDFQTVVQDLLQGIQPPDYAREVLGGIVDAYCLEMRPRIDDSGLGIP